ncbi:50S ribosomal protein L2 [archaeon]|jgi:large subunit ribosomal protein L2|nr:50S ribosomal protein L2 [archaeon]
MAKRIIVQRRGRGTSTYRVSKKNFRYELKYSPELEGEAEVIKLFNSSVHSAPLAKILFKKKTFYAPAFKGMVEGQKISFSNEIKDGNVVQLKDIPLKTKVYNIESRPRDGGTFMKTAGSHATIHKITEKSISIMFPSKKEKKLNKNCRAMIGVVAGAGRLDKPIIKAGKQHYIKKTKSKLWPRTSAVKMNAIDHPFGSGRAKNPKSKIAKRNAPPGKRVGLIRPRRTGKKK